MKVLPSLILSLFILGIWSCSDSGNPVDSVSNTPDPVVDDCGVTGGDNSSCVNYSTEIQPIFSTNSLCTGCHGGSGGLYLDSYTNLMTGGNSGAVVIPENGAGSLLVEKLRDEHAPSMPLGNCCIESSLIDLIETWIDEGAQNN